MVDLGGYICHGYMCILLYVTLIQCSGVPQIYGQLGGTSPNMCILLYVKLIWCSGVPEIYAQLVGTSPNMCILLYVKLIWCSGVPQIYAQLGVHLPICAFFYM